MVFHTRMLPLKTDLARQALQSHAAPLGMRERQVLILCDGRRKLEELTALLGPGTAEQVERLSAAGYLAIAPMHAISAPQTKPPTTSIPAVSATTSPRRSIIAAKLYVIGMLELQRHESTVSHRKKLQACQDPEATVAHLLAAVHCLQRTTSSSFSQRVRERLAEVLPEPHLPALEQLQRTLSSAVE